MAEYSQIDDPDLQRRVSARYAQDISSLEGLGFEGLVFCLEALGPFSAVWQFPIVMLASPKKEVIVIRTPLRLAVATPILFHRDPPSAVLCMGMGVKIYSTFTDGTLLISSNFQSMAVPGAGSRIVKPPTFSTIDGAWLSHQKNVARIEAAGAIARQIQRLSDYVQISKLEEDRSQYQ